MRTDNKNHTSKLATLTLRDYQTECLAAIGAAEARGIQRQLVTLPTGTGKTVIFAHLLQRRPGRALILVHRDELARQAEEKILLVIPDARIGIVKAERNEIESPIAIASIQTVSRENRLQQLPRDFNTIIVDEAHHAAADSYRRVLETLGAFEPNGPLTVGFTATADRGDKQGLDCVFQAISYTRNILEMIRAGYLCDLTAKQIRLEADFNSLRSRHGEFIDREVEEMLLACDIQKYGVKAYQEHAPGKKALLFVPTVDLAHLMTDAFNGAGIPAAAIDGSTDTDVRRETLRRFHDGEIKVLSNCMVLTEGFDEPSVEVILQARPTKSRALYAQIIGRGTRLYPGKDDCLVLDFVGATSRLDLVTTASLFGVKPKPDQTVCEAVEESQAAQRYQEAVAADHGRLIAEAVDIFQKARLHWVQSGDKFTLSIGCGQIILSPADKDWKAVLYRPDRTQQTLAEKLPLAYAQGIAEDFARKQGIAAFVLRDAPWRRKPASGRQRAALTKMHIRFNGPLTAGEASDLIARRIAARVEARQ